VPAEQRIDASYLSDQVRAAAKAAMPEAKVITRENMLVLLQSGGKTLEQCEGECEVDTGRRIGADLVVSGELLRFGTQYKLNMKLHDTRSGDLVSGAVASGAAAEDLDQDLGRAVRQLLGPLLRSQAREAREAALPATSITASVTAGYDSVSSSTAGLPSGFGWHIGAHVFLRAVGALYVGGIFDYSLRNTEGPLIAGGLHVPFGPVAVSAGFGYSDQTSNGYGTGVGALVAFDVALVSGFTLRAQGLWRHSSAGSTDATVVSGSGGLAFSF